MTQLRTSPLHSDFAVEVHNQVSDLVNSPDAIEELKALWQKSPVMIYRRQSLEESELVRFSEHFGRCESTGRKDIQSPVSRADHLLQHAQVCERPFRRRLRRRR